MRYTREASILLPHDPIRHCWSPTTRFVTSSRLLIPDCVLGRRCPAGTLQPRFKTFSNLFVKFLLFDALATYFSRGRDNVVSYFCLSMALVFDLDAQCCAFGR